MDILFLSALILLPVAAWISWFAGWSKNGNSLIVFTLITAVCLYVCSAYAIHANGDEWGEFLIGPEVRKVANSGLENETELIEEVRSRKGRRLHSMTSINLPVVIAAWFAFVLLGGLAFQQFLPPIRWAWSKVRSARTTK